MVSELLCSNSSLCKEQLSLVCVEQILYELLFIGCCNITFMFVGVVACTFVFSSVHPCDVE